MKKSVGSKSGMRWKKGEEMIHAHKKAQEKTWKGERDHPTEGHNRCEVEKGRN